MSSDHCNTPRCRGETVLTYLGKPLCQACWLARCPTDDEEIHMSKTSKKPSAKKSTKATPKLDAKAGKPARQPKRTSALHAAAEVLRKSGKPMRSQELITAMAEQGLWTSPNGKTPHATLYAAMTREITAKGKEARFRKTERGLFEFAG